MPVVRMSEAISGAVLEWSRISLRNRMAGQRPLIPGGCDAGPQMVETRPAEGVDGVRRRSFVRRASEGRGATGGGGDAGSDRGREEGRQAFVLFGAWTQ